MDGPIPHWGEGSGSATGASGTGWVVVFVLRFLRARMAVPESVVAERLFWARVVTELFSYIYRIYGQTLTHS